MVDILEKSRTAPLEILLIDPELADGFRAYEDEAFSWEADKFRRLNYLSGADLTVEILQAKISKFHEAGFLVVVLVDRINSSLMRALRKIDEGLVPSVKLATWESYGKELMNFMDFPQVELFDDQLEMTGGTEPVRKAMAVALQKWLPENMEMTKEKINEVVRRLDPISTSKEFSDWLAGLPEKFAGEVQAFLEGLAPGQTLFAAGAAGAGEIPGDAIVHMFKPSQGQDMDFTGRLVRGGEEEADKFIVNTVSDDEELMRRIQIVVATSQGQYHLAMEKKQRVKSMGNWDPFGAMDSGHDMHVMGLATGMSSPRKDKFSYKAEMQLQAGEIISDFNVQVISEPDKSSGDEK